MPLRANCLLTALLALLALTATAGEPARPPSGPAAKSGKPGAILCEFFRGIDSGGIDALVKNPNFPNKPSESILLNAFEIPTDTEDRYGTTVRGYILPPTTGNYTFWISSDDASELWLSPTDNPAEKIKLCQVNSWTPPRAWDTSPEQKSKPVPLVGGRSYYIEALHKEGEGGDNLAVGWQLPDGKQERPIPGSRLIPAGIPKPPPPITVAIQGALPRTPGFHKCMSKVSGGTEPFDFPFLLYVPADFGQAPVPSLLFLHGVGECGSDLEGVYGNGPHGHIRGNADLRKKMPMLVIGPQITPGRSWSQRVVIRATVALLDEILKGYGQSVDKDRVTMTGLSLGGAGVWHVAMEAPDRFAAIAPCDPRAVNPSLATERLKNLPVWIIAGGADGDFTKGAQEMFDALQSNVPKPELKLIPNSGHGAWSFYYPRWEFYTWLLKWHRQPGRAAEAIAVAPKPVDPPAKPPTPPVAPSAKPPEVAAKPAPPQPDPTPPAAPKPPPVAIALLPVTPPKPPAVIAPPPVVAAPVPAPTPPVAVKPPTPAPPPAVIAPPIAVAKKDEPVIAARPKAVEPPAAIEIKPKPAPTPITAPAVIAATEPEPAPVRRNTRFPYAHLSLLTALLFLGASTYFLATKDELSDEGLDEAIN